ncbi:uncharacterized protein LOC117160609 [Bombus vancouverensis nearcticus]|uniref:Uncharacterized protein LOC117208963 n=1 Tax=Bombus bifarius TaxID=103933 RepID=A0A6P8MW13_9HYME|nr:uncharacterized protein LOC117160609 [Bombus vancouverensis nearcticus]XP_033306405.1 uncharacterized protein LOC117208963 [Bombus bifarius]
MRDNECTKIIGSNVILVPYKKKHVERYHEWMKSAELRYFTGSEMLTLEEEFQMQQRWHQDQDKCTFIILEKTVFTTSGNEIEAMIGDTNLFFNESDQPNTAEVEIMIANVTYRRKKRGWEAMILMLLYGISVLNVTKYIAKIKFDNEKSIKMFEKLGFHKKRPLLFNSMIYGSFYTGAEFAQQTYTNIEETNTFEIKKPLSLWIRNFNQKLGLLDENNSAQSRSYNWAQLKRYAIYGCFIAGPILHGWYKWLDIFYKGQTIKIVLTKLLVDQFILTPPLITLFFISMSLMEGKLNPLDECKAKFLQTFKTSCMYWLPVQFLNFLLVPSALRVSFVSIAAFCWVNILCYLKSIPVSECNNNQIKY